MIFRSDVKFKYTRRYVYLQAKCHAEAQDRTRKELLDSLDCADSDFTILEVVSESEKPHILRGVIIENGENIEYDQNPIFLTPKPLFNPGQGSD
jgi:hypothetical protein